MVQLLATLDGPGAVEDPHDSVVAKTGYSRYRRAFGTAPTQSLDVRLNLAHREGTMISLRVLFRQNLERDVA